MENFNKPEEQTASDNFSSSFNQKDFLRTQSNWGEISPVESEYIDKKGFKTPQDLLKSYRELEKAYSSKVTLPKDGDKKAFDKLYSRLGMPDSADGFDIKFLPEDQSLEQKFKQVCFENHILPESARAIYEWYCKNREEMLALDDEKKVEISQKDFLEQKTEWGYDADRKLEMMKRGIRLFSDDLAIVDTMETALGTKKMMEIFSKLGEAISEDNSVAFGKKTAHKAQFDSLAYFREMFNDY